MTTRDRWGRVITPPAPPRPSARDLAGALPASTSVRSSSATVFTFDAPGQGFHTECVHEHHGCGISRQLLDEGTPHVVLTRAEAQRRGYVMCMQIGCGR